ncbi:hypothetical protein F8M49_21120 [Rhodococcus zopfii]|uniref:Uncharacterized protein n=1 Tax=Rhodococcus zopfii TaxID=43772 RepID=A0ABU3WTA5_9NOCA|nr:hypothetical protein [Rhodococcus zopfii]MDV2477223.1 hypothetical protein [Rhodococcus zopfii]
MSAKTYRKRPVEIEAMQMPEPYPHGVDPSSDGYARNIAAAKVLDWIRGHLGDGVEPYDHDGADRSIPANTWSIHPGNGKLILGTLEGPLFVSPGDWVIRGVAGEFYPCKPDIFAATYEAVEP